MFLHYGFLPNLPLEYYEPSIHLPLSTSDPLYSFKLEAISKCWPMHDSDWKPVMMKWGSSNFYLPFLIFLNRYLPVEVLQRAMIIQEHRLEVLSNVTHVEEYICKSTSMFAVRDIESLRRNKRAMLTVGLFFSCFECALCDCCFFGRFMMHLLRSFPGSRRKKRMSVPWPSLISRMYCEICWWFERGIERTCKRVWGDLERVFGDCWNKFT